MTRAQLEHIIRAAGTIADAEDIVVPRHYPERVDLIDATIGQDSPFRNRSGITRTA